MPCDAQAPAEGRCPVAWALPSPSRLPLPNTMPKVLVPWLETSFPPWNRTPSKSWWLAWMPESSTSPRTPWPQMPWWPPAARRPSPGAPGPCRRRAPSSGRPTSRRRGRRGAQLRAVDDEIDHVAVREVLHHGRAQFSAAAAMRSLAPAPHSSAITCTRCRPDRPRGHPASAAPGLRSGRTGDRARCARPCPARPPPPSRPEPCARCGRCGEDSASTSAPRKASASRHSGRLEGTELHQEQPPVLGLGEAGWGAGSDWPRPARTVSSISSMGTSCASDHVAPWSRLRAKKRTPSSSQSAKRTCPAGSASERPGRTVAEVSRRTRGTPPRSASTLTTLTAPSFRTSTRSGAAQALAGIGRRGTAPQRPGALVHSRSISASSQPPRTSMEPREPAPPGAATRGLGAGHVALRNARSCCDADWLAGA